MQVLELDAAFVELAQQCRNAGFRGLRVEGVEQLGAVLHQFQRQAGESRRDHRERTLQVANRLDSIPAALSGFGLTIAGDGHELVYDYDTQADRTGVATLLGALGSAGVRIRDLNTTQSSLEEIFVGLVHESQEQP